MEIVLACPVMTQLSVQSKAPGFVAESFIKGNLGYRVPFVAEASEHKAFHSSHDPFNNRIVAPNTLKDRGASGFAFRSEP